MTVGWVWNLIFFCNLEEKLALAEVIGTHLNLLKSKVEYFLTMNKPQVNCNGNTNVLVAGRFDLPMFKQVPSKRSLNQFLFHFDLRNLVLL